MASMMNRIDRAFRVDFSEEVELKDIEESQSYMPKSSIGGCRICLEEEAGVDNPLLHLCKCTGSVKYLHLNCLTEWINSRRAVNEHQHYSIWAWKNLSWEIWKENYDQEHFYDTTKVSIHLHSS